ncbi:hypothetical protein, partial [Thiolapillus sp.]|uniref:hypothetical protein n=1 Tax=Thiolapillus sp. TaxID=2017437 RepID=UPI003AF45CDF
MTRTAGAPIGCQRPSRFWGLGRPKIYHEAEDTLVLSRSASLTFLAFRRFIVQPGINPNLTDYIEPTSQHGLDK